MSENKIVEGVGEARVDMAKLYARIAKVELVKKNEKGEVTERIVIEEKHGDD